MPADWRTCSARRRPLRLGLEEMEPRLALTASAVSTFRTLSLSVSASFSGTVTLGDYKDSFSGVEQVTGSVAFTSPTVGSGTLNGTGSGSGKDNYGNYTFTDASSVTGKVNNGMLNTTTGSASSRYTYTNGGGSGTGGGYFGRIPMAGTFNPQTFATSGSGSSTVQGALVSGSFSGTVVDKAATNTDLIASGKFTSAGVEFEVNVTGKFMRTPAMATAVTKAQVFWSKTADLSGKLSEVAVGQPLDIYWNTGKLTLKADTFGNIPLDARYLLFQVDGAGKISEASESNNLVALKLPEAKLTLVSAGPVNPVQGQQVSMGVQIQIVDASPLPTPRGHVAFADIYNTVSTAIATVKSSSTGFAGVSKLISGVGKHTFAAAYVVDSFYRFQGAVVSDITVAKANTTTTLVDSPTTTVVGQEKTLTATVKAVAPGGLAPQGSVTFKDGSKVLGTVTLSATGTAVFKTTALTVGTHSLTLVYSGNANYVTSTSAAKSVVVNPAVSATTTTLAAVATTVYGQPAKLVATVASKVAGTPTPTGSVSFYTGSTLLGTASLVAGKATLSKALGNVATHNLKAVYAATTNFSASTSAVVQAVVSKAAAVATLTVPTVAQFQIGVNYSFSITVGVRSPGAALPTGIVEFYDNGVKIEVKMNVPGTNKSSGNFLYKFTTPGPHRIYMLYKGDGHLNAASSLPVTFEVVV